MSRPRILSLTTIYPNELNAAEGRSVAHLDRALAYDGLAGTTLVLRPYAPRWLAQRRAEWSHLAVRDREQVRANVRVFFTHYLHLPTRYSLTQCVNSMAARAISLIEKHGLKFDLVHGQSIYPAALAARRVAARYGKPFIITLRDDLSHLQYLYDTRHAARPLFDEMWRSVAAVFCHGPALARDVHRFLPAEAHPQVVLAPNGVDTVGLERLLSELPPPPPHPWGQIVSVGNLFRYKGIHENLRALSLLNERGLRDWHYTVVGEGPYRAELETLAQELGLRPRVTFRGRLPHPEAIGAIRQADIFSLPSWAEPFGNVYAEAAICERPAIGCRGFGAELMIRDGATGILVPPKEIEPLAAALEFLLTHPAEAKHMGAQARVHVRQFTWARTAELYRNAISQIASNAA